MIKSKTLYVFRHGETYYTKNNIPYGDEVYRAEILPERIPVVKKLANHLKDIDTDKNFTSPFIRCLQTVKIVEEVTGKKFIKDDRLGEYVEEKQTFESIVKRIKSFLDEIEKHDLQTVAICTHGAIIAGIVSFMEKGEYKIEDLLSFPNPGILVEIKDKTAKYTDFNL